MLEKVERNFKIDEDSGSPISFLKPNEIELQKKNKMNTANAFYVMIFENKKVIAPLIS